MTFDPLVDRFCQEYLANGGNASAAYREAKPRSKEWKPESVNSKASTFLKSEKVQARLADLQRESAERHNITIESLTKMLLDDRDLARTTNKAAPAVQAVMGLAKLHGLVVDKAELAGKDGQPLNPTINVSVGRNA